MLKCGLVYSRRGQAVVRQISERKPSFFALFILCHFIDTSAHSRHKALIRLRATPLLSGFLLGSIGPGAFSLCLRGVAWEADICAVWRVLVSVFYAAARGASGERLVRAQEYAQGMI